jgi:hypothetical protein
MQSLQDADRVGYAESQVMPSFDLSALCSSSRVTGFHPPSSA